ncbi:peptidoglycan DD-metalloendopeptidase family protein [Paraburkholderia sp. DHOC27]|uniref:peptidoglycan DD-metalloendopeptidase family protein n=1 Tax=Paraburkholderia sp. DHOC27 TaxID=2303330 RepID=UPI000E3E813E|nr:peptidoglycan DD-metalloendopeptidase family protein [Paraburkholderia sp. DHOC27]RFU49412.1 LysM peptidoglycan-binding domain-containing protein [Paraburkholderia sp. DHOC27]
MRDKSLRAFSQTLFAVSIVVALAGCTISPWGSSPESYNGASGNYQTNGAAMNPVPPGYYRVNPGDTLPAIANAFGQHPQDVARWNGMLPNASVYVGQVLRVAPPAVAGVPPVGGPNPAAGAPGAVPGPGGPALAQGAAQQGVLTWPLRGPILKNFANGNGKGIVIGGHVGDPVRAAAAGRVVYAGTGIEAYGPLIIIKHDDSLITAYGQNSTLLVKEGDAVTQGQAIGAVGSDSHGVASIQFEVRKDGHPVDPLEWLPRAGG